MFFVGVGVIFCGLGGKSSGFWSNCSHLGLLSLNLFKFGSFLGYWRDFGPFLGGIGSFFGVSARI